MKNMTIGYPEFLLVGGIVMCIFSPGSLAISITSLSVLAAFGRATLRINYLNKEEERRDAEEKRRIKAEERVDKIIDKLADGNKLQAAANINNFLGTAFDGGDDNGGNGGGWNH